MRVIGGKFKGKNLAAISGNAIRPTSDRLRETIFNIAAGSVSNAVVLDLFAGTGAMGIEAISRGARFSVFIDNSKIAIAAILKNLKNCRIEEKARVIRWNIGRNFDCLQGTERRFDLVFLDPPYERGFVRPALMHLERLPVFSADSLLVVEHSRREEIPTDLSGFALFDQRAYGKTLVSFLAGVV